MEEPKKMKLQYVGAKPIVSKNGVSFDQTKPDKYTFLPVALELLEALDTAQVDESGSVDLKKLDAKEYRPSEMLELLKKHCGDMLPLAEESDRETEEWIDGMQEKVEKSTTLSPNDRAALLGNIKIMRNYYRQYMVNEFAYNCLLKKMADKMVKRHIHEIAFKLYQNFGLVFSHLIPVLTDHRPPVDAQITIEENNEGAFGRLKTYSSPKA